MLELLQAPSCRVSRRGCFRRNGATMACGMLRLSETRWSKIKDLGKRWIGLNGNSRTSTLMFRANGRIARMGLIPVVSYTSTSRSWIPNTTSLRSLAERSRSSASFIDVKRTCSCSKTSVGRVACLLLVTYPDRIEQCRCLEVAA